MKLKKVDQKPKLKMKPTLPPPQKKKVNPKEVLSNRRSYCDEIHEELQEKGVDFFTPSESGGSLNIDNSYLTLPRNITEVTPRDLGEYLNAFTQQKMYMRTLVGYAEMFMEEARRAYMYASEDLYRELSHSRLSETAKEREVNSDPVVKPLFQEYMDCKNKVKLLNLNILSIEEAIFLISREVSRRNSDFDNETRGYNVSRM